MGRFSKVSMDSFDQFQVDAGILLRSFDPESGDFEDEDIICATTGGISVSCVPSYSDMGEDVDNCPAGMMELKKIDNWEATFGFTALDTTIEIVKMALGAADYDDGNEISPRKNLIDDDFSDVWWVGDRIDGSFVAVRLKNALSTSGFSLQTNKNGKGQISVTLTGHFSVNNQNEVPMTFYVGAVSN